MSEPDPRRNLLGDESSPYLLQHRDNPVHWMPWGDEAFAMAGDTGRPVLLSIGYAACHWCHVMAHESFEDDAIAAQMNRLFVNVKVDREERPDVDAIYQQALQLLGEQGGWPLTMFLTPDRKPFWGGTYFPPEDRYGRPGFPTVLSSISQIYQNETEKVVSNTAALTEALEKMSEVSPGAGITDAIVDQAAESFLRGVDTVHGGLGGAPKFPQGPVFEFLWRAWRRTGVPQYRDAVLVTLDRMSQGGIYDHVGGGFARYSVDAVWLVPHFEKMLYDNAQLIDLLSLAWRDTGSPLYRERVAETVDWLMREMVVEGGGFAGTLDADSEGEEGKFYVWTEAEIDAALGADAPLFKTAYDVTPGGNWEGNTILNRSRKPLRMPEDDEATLKACREKLLTVRAGRIRPGLDDKVMADWNGLMIAALAQASRVFGRPDWLDAAIAAWEFVVGQVSDGGRLRHTWRAGQASQPATLEDYAHMMRAALALHQATQETIYLDQATAWLDILDAHYLDAATGVYNFAADDVGDLIVRTRPFFDNATPSGNGTLVQNLARLWLLTGDADYRERGERLMQAVSGDLQRTAMAMPTLLSGRELFANGVQVVIAGDGGGANDLRETAWAAADPNIVIQELADGAALPPGHPAHGKGPVDGKPAAYVCRGNTCSLPLSEAQLLQDALKST